MVSDEAWLLRATGLGRNEAGRAWGTGPDLNGAALRSTLWYLCERNLEECRDGVITETKGQ